MIPCERRRPDVDLVREALLGFRGALAELPTRRWDTAVFLAARVLLSTELARDAAQEAAIAAMTDLGGLRSPERFGAWFCGIRLGVARRWLRQLRPELPGLPPDQASPVPGPAEVAESASTSARVCSAIAALDSELFNLTTPAEYASDLASCPVATAEIAAGVRQRLRERYSAAPWQR